MKRYKSKFMRTMNFIKNEGKFDFSDEVEVIKITGRDNVEASQKYRKYFRQKGRIEHIDYAMPEYMFAVRFDDGELINFKEIELKKTGW